MCATVNVKGLLLKFHLRADTKWVVSNSLTKSSDSSNAWPTLETQICEKEAKSSQVIHTSDDEYEQKDRLVIVCPVWRASKERRHLIRTETIDREARL